MSVVGQLEGVVGRPVRVQIPPSAPSQYLKGIRFQPVSLFLFSSVFGQISELDPELEDAGEDL